MTIGQVSYQAYLDTGYAIGASVPVPPSSYELQGSMYASGMPAPEGVNIDTQRAIDILLGQLEQISYQLHLFSRTEPQTEPAIVQANTDFEPIRTAEAYADDQARFDALVEQYAQLRAEVEEADLSQPYGPTAGPFAGMLFEFGV